MGSYPDTDIDPKFLARNSWVVSAFSLSADRFNVLSVLRF